MSKLKIGFFIAASLLTANTFADDVDSSPQFANIQNQMSAPIVLYSPGSEKPFSVTINPGFYNYLTYNQAVSICGNTAGCDVAIELEDKTLIGGFSMQVAPGTQGVVPNSGSSPKNAYTVGTWENGVSIYSNQQQTKK